MTGFGTGRAVDGDRSFLVEIRAVNHKFCEVRTRLPHELTLLDGRLQGFVRDRVARGRVDLSVEISYGSSTIHRPRLNLPLARGYLAAFEELRNELGLSAPIPLELIAGSPGVIEAPAVTGDLETTARELERAVSLALVGLNVMREREGATLRQELLRLLEEMRDQVVLVQREIPAAGVVRKQKLEQRLREMLGDNTIDPSRLAQEVAMLVDRADVTEEIARLESHTDQFGRQLDASEPVGRKLDFLLQEMHREANTIGSKSSSARISHLVVDLKSAVERMREQVQNVE